MNPPELFAPWDMEVASANFGAMCGHGALAAATGTDVCRVMQHFPEGGGYVNIPTMTSAVARAVGPTSYQGCSTWMLLPPDGSIRAVTMIQWLGPWMQPEVPPAARCKHRHWVATRSGLIWDCNLGFWCSREHWTETIPPILMPKRGTGWNVCKTFFWDQP